MPTVASVMQRLSNLVRGRTSAAGDVGTQQTPAPVVSRRTVITVAAVAGVVTTTGVGVGIAVSDDKPDSRDRIVTPPRSKLLQPFIDKQAAEIRRAQGAHEGIVASGKSVASEATIREAVAGNEPLAIKEVATLIASMPPFSGGFSEKSEIAAEQYKHFATVLPVVRDALLELAGPHDLANNVDETKLRYREQYALAAELHQIVAGQEVTDILRNGSRADRYPARAHPGDAYVTRGSVRSHNVYIREDATKAAFDVAERAVGFAQVYARSASDDAYVADVNALSALNLVRLTAQEFEKVSSAKGRCVRLRETLKTMAGVSTGQTRRDGIAGYAQQRLTSWFESTKAGPKPAYRADSHMGVIDYGESTTAGVGQGSCNQQLAQMKTLISTTQSLPVLNR